MRDCSNAEMRDRLPELIYGQLRGTELEAVRAHVAGCSDCREELALLEEVRSALTTPVVDVPRIVAALPRYRPAPAWRRALQSTQLRAAAAIVLLVGAYATLTRSAGRVEQAFVDTVRQETTRVATAETASATTPRAPTVELAIGESFQDLSDSDLAAVLDALGKIEAVTPDATEDVVVPVTARPGSGGA